MDEAQSSAPSPNSRLLSADELVELADRVLTFDRGAVTGERAGEDLTPARVLAAMTEKGATA